VTVVILGWMKTKSILSGGSFGPLSLCIIPYLAQARQQGYAIGSLYEQVHISPCAGLAEKFDEEFVALFGEALALGACGALPRQKVGIRLRGRRENDGGIFRGWWG